MSNTKSDKCQILFAQPQQPRLFPAIQPYLKIGKCNAYFEVAFVLQLKNVSKSVTQKETANVGNGGDVEMKLCHPLIATSTNIAHNAMARIVKSATVSLT